MRKANLSITFIILALKTIFAQDVIYTVSGEIDKSKIALDSILVENLTNDTRILFGELPEQDFYQINLTKNTLEGTVGINEINENIHAFAVSKNIPGLISISYLKNEPVEIKVSVFNIQGQKVFGSAKQKLYTANLINIAINHAGVYFVRVESPFGSQTFKALGSVDVTGFALEIAHKANIHNVTKSGAVSSNSDFSFTPGDSVRVTAFKTDYYARPIGKNITASENINFLFDVSSTLTDSISDAYVALNKVTTDIKAYNPITGTVQMTYTSAIPDLKPGDIITVDVDTMGYLRKVKETKKEDGSLTVTTGQAYLNEVFVGKDFKLHTGLMTPGVQLKSTSSAKDISAALTDEKGYIHPVEVIYMENSGKLITKSALSGLVENDGTVPIIDFYRDLSMDLYGKEGDNVHFYIDEGHVSFTSDAIFDFDFDFKGTLTEDTKIKEGEINSFSYYLDGRTEFLTKLALDMGNSYEKEEKKKLLDLKKITAKFFVGPVPVWVTFDVDIFGNYHFNADASLHADWGFKSNHTLKIGSTYNRQTDEFTPTKEYTPENTVFPMNIEGEVNALARFEIYPRTEIKFYSFLGPYTEIAPYAQGNYNASLQSQITANGTENFLAWNSGIDLGLDFRTGIELDFLGLEKELVPTILNGPVWPLWQTPTHIKLLTALPEEKDVGSVQSLKFKVTDLSDNVVPLCPIYITGDGSFSNQILFTDIIGEATVDWTLPTAEGHADFTATIYKADKTIVQDIVESLNVKDSASAQTGTFTDSRDGHIYKWVKIGDQVWMGENLAYNSGAGCWALNDDLNNVVTYGRLYSWDAAKASCPTGWHLPSDEEWKSLEMFLGMSRSEVDSEQSRGTNEGTKLKATSGWIDVGDGNGTDDYGFTALPGSFINPNGDFGEKGYFAYFWTSSGYNNNSFLAWCRRLNYSSGNVNRDYYTTSSGLSVRCVKD